MSEKIAVNVITQEQWDDVTKRLNYTWNGDWWHKYKRSTCISTTRKTYESEYYYKREGFKVVSYEDFIENRIDSIEDIERLWKEGRLDKVVNKFYTFTIYEIDLNSETVLVGTSKVVDFKDIDIEETQKLIKKERKMTKKDLETGMMVKYSNGKFAMVFRIDNRLLFLIKEDTYLLRKLAENLREDIYTEDLKTNVATWKGTWDIIEVFELNGCDLTFDMSNYRSIWTRPEEKSPTQIELENINKQIDELKESAKRLQEAIDKDN